MTNIVRKIAVVVVPGDRKNKVKPVKAVVTVTHPQFEDGEVQAVPNLNQTLKRAFKVLAQQLPAKTDEKNATLKSLIEGMRGQGILTPEAEKILSDRMTPLPTEVTFTLEDLPSEDPKRGPKGSEPTAAAEVEDDSEESEDSEESTQ